MKPQVQFLPVRDNRSKLGTICETVQRVFNEGGRVLIAVPNEAAAKYVNELLWRLPQESFLPHILSQENSKERVVITTVQQNLNQATVLFNLCPTISPISEQFETIYELMDETDPEKAKLSRERQQGYV